MLELALEQAGCTAYRQPSDSHAGRLVDLALDHGRRAARHGLYVPLPLALDMVNALHAFQRELEAPPYRGAGGKEALEYRAWLEAFLSEWRERATAEHLESGARIDFWHLFSGLGRPLPWDAWPAGEPGEIYRSLAKAKADILKKWKGSPSRNGAWSWWRGEDRLPGNPMLAPEAWPGLLWSQTGRGGRFRRLVPEYFDHAAAGLFFQAQDYRTFPRQTLMIESLKAKPRRITGQWDPSAHEEITVGKGAIAISTLAKGDWGEADIVNGRDPRFATPRTSPPRNETHLHLAWAAGWPSALRGLSSTLQGLAALCLEDMRAALRGLQVRFHFHRLHPCPMQADLGKPAPRWKHAGLLPRELIRGPLRRISLDLFRPGEAAPVQRSSHLAGAGRRHACFLFLSHADLGYLDIQHHPDGSLDLGKWSALSGLRFQHAFLLDFSASPPAFTWFASGDGIRSQGLWQPRTPVAMPGGAWEPGDYLDLRANVMEAVLEELRKRILGFARI